MATDLGPVRATRRKKILLYFSQKLDRQKRTAVKSFCGQQLKVGYGLLWEGSFSRVRIWPS